MSHDNEDLQRASARGYWRATLRLTFSLLVLWAAVSFLPGWYADELNEVVFLGWPLGFYMGAQGALICFLLIVWFYDWRMTCIEKRYRLGNDG